MIWIFILFVVGCSESHPPKEKKSVSDFHEHEIANPNIIISREDAKIVSARSNTLLKNGDRNATLIGNVIADFFNENGDHTSTLYSDSAKIDQHTNNLIAMGHVHVKSDSGFSLYANTILWDNQYKLIESKDSVMFTTTEQDTMYGIGFESDMDLSQWKIFKPIGVSQREF